MEFHLSSKMKDYHKEVLTAMIICCRNFDLKNFIPFLMSENVLTNYENKVQFYRIMKNKFECAKKITDGILICKIEKKEWQLNPKAHLFNFYDQTHKNERLSIEVEFEKGNLILDIQPF